MAASRQEILDAMALKRKEESGAPTRDEILAAMKAKEPELSFEEKINKGVAGGLLGAAQGVVTSLSGLGEMADWASKKIGAVPIPGPMGTLQGPPSPIPHPDLYKLLGPKAEALRETFPAKAGEFVGEYAIPGAIGTRAGTLAAKGAMRAIPALEKYITAVPMAAQSLATGAATAAMTPGSAQDRALAGAGASVFPMAFHGAVEGARKVGVHRGLMKAAKAAKKKIDSVATGVLKSWQGGAEKGTASHGILQAVKDNYKKLNEKYSGIRDKNKKLIKKGLFDKHQDLARESGYADSPLIHPKKQTPSKLILPPGVRPPVAKGPSLKPGAKALPPIASKALLKEIINSKSFRDTALKDVVETYLKQPSFANLHKAQSVIGAEAHLYDQATTEGERLTKNLLKKAKAALLSDAETGMAKNADHGLHKKYLDIREGFRKEVTPYSEDTAIRNVRQGKSGVDTIKTSLLSGKPTSEKVLSDLSPKVRRQLMASKLEKGVFKRGPKGELKVDAQDLIKGYDSLEEVLAGQLKDSASQKNIEYLRKLTEDIAPLEKYSERMKKIKKIVGIGTVAGASGQALNYARELLGE